MTALRFEPAATGGYQVSGPLDFETVHEIWASSRAALAAAPDLHIDLGGVTHIDSAGLALVLEWSALARAAGRKLELLRAPAKLFDLARISEVESFLEAGSATGDSGRSHGAGSASASSAKSSSG